MLVSARKSHRAWFANAGKDQKDHLMLASNYLRELERVQKRGAQLTQKRADLLQKRQQLEEDMEKNEQEAKDNAQEEERILLQLRQDIDGHLQQRGQEEGQVRPISWLGYGRLQIGCSGGNTVSHMVAMIDHAFSMASMRSKIHYSSTRYGQVCT